MPTITKRKALTIEDLIKFCKENKLYSFDSKNQGYRLSVQVPTTFEVEESVDEAHRGMLKLKFKIFHTGLNRNGSFVSEEAAKDAMPTIKNRPIMAAIHQLDNGEWDFESHNIEIVKNEETGEEEIVYIEKQVGSFDESDPFFEYDEKLDKTFICSYGYIAEDYTKAADIIRRKNGTKNSCELSIDEFSYNAKEHYLSLDKFYVAASTLLGSHADGTEIKEGMLGSRADIADFSTENNSVQHTTNEELLNELKKLNENLSHFNIKQADLSAGDNSQKGGSLVTKFEELLEQFGVTAEDVTFECEGLTDEELEAKFAEVFGEAGTEEEGADPEPSNDEGEETIVIEETEEVVEETVVTEEETTEEVPTDDGEENPVVVEEVVAPTKYSITMSDGLVKEFELSLDDISNALYSLVNSTWGEIDNAWYSVEVYESYVVMHDWWEGKNFKQGYSREGDEFSLTGDRVEVFANWLTKDEENQLAELRSNYSSIKEQLEKYQSAEAKAQKEEILTKEAYAKYLETDEFKTLSEKMDEYTVEEFGVKADLAFAKCVQKLGFSLEDKPATKVKGMSLLNRDKDRKKNTRYGALKFD